MREIDGEVYEQYTSFSLVYIVKEDLSTLGYSAFPCEMNVLKVLKEGSCEQLEAAQWSGM